MGGEAPADGHAAEDRHVDGVVAPEIERRAALGFEELQPRDLAVAAVQDRVQEEEERARDLPAGGRGEEERRRRQADGERDERHRVRGDRGPDEAPRQRERDQPLDVAGHEALGVLDETAQQPRLGAAQVAGRANSEAALLIRGPLDRREPAFEGGDALGRARRAPRGVEHRLRIVGVHHGDLRGIHPERLGLERHGGQGPQPPRLRDDVGRHEDHTPSSRLRGRDGGESRARPGEQQAPPERQPRHHRLGGDVGRRAFGHDHEKALRHRRDPARGRRAERQLHAAAPARLASQVLDLAAERRFGEGLRVPRAP